MKKAMNTLGICLLLAVFFWCGTLLSDRQRLSQDLIRLHVVANSDSRQDQYLKLRVRDVVTESLRSGMQDVTDVEAAKAYIQEKLPQIRQLVCDTLKSLGCADSVSVQLCREGFDVRHYDTFSLPAGVYESLRIVLGDGGGQNWWCVVFPALCLPAASDGMENVAAGAGFPDSLNESLTGEAELRFGLLDAMGKLENCLFGE